MINLKIKLEDCSLFADIPEACECFENELPVHFQKGDIIYDQKKYHKALGVLLKGKAQANPLGNRKSVLSRFEPGALFGAAAVFSDSPSYVSEITALSDCEVLFISEKALRECILRYPQVGLNYIAFLSDRIRFLNGKIAVLNQDDAQSKVYSYLSNLCDTNGMTEDINFSQMAKNLSLGRTSLYRVLDELEKANMIERKNKKILVKG